MKSPFKNPFFLIGFLYITGLTAASFIYSGAVHNKVHIVRFLYDKQHNIIAVSPISPRLQLPFGTDRLGFDMFSKILLGAKFTILGALSVAAMRMVIAVPLGLFLGVYLRRYKKYINGLVDSFHFVPLTVLAFYILFPILWEPESGFKTTMLVRTLLEIAILALLTVPVIAVVIGNETGRIYNQEYITSAQTLGAGKLRLIIKHIYPGLKEKIFVLFAQQAMQALIVFSHLGYLKLYFGGTHVTYDLVNDPPRSMTNEWSGLIGDTFEYLHAAAWVPLTPIFCFALSMLAISLMIEGYVQATTGYSHYFKRKRQKTASGKNINIKAEKEQLVLQKGVSSFK